MRWSIIVFSILTSLSISISCTRTQSIKTNAPLTDPRDGKAYVCKQIGNQIWMVENLAYETKSGESTFYASDSIKYHKYGRMYFSEEIKEAANIPGWHLPDSSEWRQLFEFYRLEEGIYQENKPAKDNWDINHFEDIALFQGKEKGGFNFLYGGLWHQKFIQPGKFKRAFEFRNNAGFYWCSTSSNKETYMHVGMGLYKSYWIEISKNNPFLTRKSKGNFRFNIRLVKD